jgi:hypothetical protein
MRFWLVFGVAPLSAMAIACSNTEAVGLPDDSGPEGAAHDATTNDAAAADATVDGGTDAPAQDSTAPSDATDAGSADVTVDGGPVADGSNPSDACIACDGGMCCAPFVCRASGNCSSCLGMYESCGGQQDCCSHVCEGGLCQ